MAKIVVIVALAVCPLAALPAAAAQAEPVTFSGTAVDPLGAPIPGATLILTNAQGRATYETTADGDGRFAFPPLPPGEYRLDGRSGAELPQVRSITGRISSPVGMLLTVVGEPITLRAGETLRRDVTLELGPVYVNASVRIDPPADVERPRVPFPDNWRCVGEIPGLCGPPSLVEEFERDLRDQGRVPADVQPPRPVIWVTADYPAGLRGTDTTGGVRLDGRIGTDGFLTGLRVVNAAHPDLAQAALDGAARARWDPARIRGTLVEVPAQLTFEFVSLER